MEIDTDGGDLFNAYQRQAAQAALYPKSPDVAGVPLYPVLGLCDEAGEVAAKFKKCLRGDKPLSIDALCDELGDCLWYLAAVAREAGIPLSSVAMRNLEKLKSRVERGVVKGDGDNR
jgi:NTP pyrophosphatase (non-canonical NTP hydrolase)